MSEQRYLWADAHAVAREIYECLNPACMRIEIAGSLRRCKPDVGDIEILYVSRIQEESDPDNFFGTRAVALADTIISALMIQCVLELRRSEAGKTAYGPKNKLMRHVASGIPVDLFATTEECWFNALVCRTGPAELNKAIAAAAIARGWHWNVYGRGFSRPAGNTRETEVHPVTSERGVFEFVGIQYMEPEARK